MNELTMFNAVKGCANLSDFLVFKTDYLISDLRECPKMCQIAT